MVDVAQQRLWELAQQGASTTEGVTVSVVDWPQRLVEVDVGGLRIVMTWAGPPPLDGQRVRVMSAGKIRFCVSVFGASIGTVQVISGAQANVLGDDGVVYVYPFLGSAPPNGAVVRLDHAARVVLPGVFSTSPVGADPEAPVPAPPPPTAGGSAAFDPIWSGNWSNGTDRGNLVEISTSRVGLYGYGTQIANTIPDGATITRAELHLTENWDNVPGVASSMGTHGYNGRPGSGVSNGSLTGDYAVPGLVQDLRGEVADRLKTGAALGIGFRAGSTGWRQYGAAPGSGRIWMEWR